MNVGIYYGSTMGDTALIAEKLGESFNVGAVPISQGLTNINNFDLILLGSSTWGYGDLQDEWNDEIENLKKVNLAGKKNRDFWNW
jgi:flavodoxin I